MTHEFCFFYSKYNCASMVGVRCNLFEKIVTRDICEKCPFYIQEREVTQMIKRYVFERECENGRKNEKDNNQ